MFRKHKNKIKKMFSQGNSVAENSRVDYKGNTGNG
jgi:hypothetical protein